MKITFAFKKLLAAMPTIAAMKNSFVQLNKKLVLLLLMLATGLAAHATIQTGIALRGLKQTVNGKTYYAFVIQSPWGGDQIPRREGSSHTFSNATMAGVTLNGTLTFQESSSGATDVITASSFTVTIENSSLWFYGATVQTMSGTDVTNCSTSVSSNNHTLTVSIPQGKTFGTIIVDYVSNAPISSSNTVISGVEDSYLYLGDPIEPEPVVTYNNTVLTKDTDYTLSYWGSNRIGEAQITVTGTGEYAGDISKRYNIRKVALTDFNSLGNNTYEIATTTDLDYLALYIGGNDHGSGITFKQTADIAYSPTTTWNQGGENNFTAIGGYGNSFRGTYDGQNHTISGIRIYKNGEGDYDGSQGLFGYISSGAIVKNVILANTNICGHENTGGIVGYNSGTIEDCVVESNVYVRTIKGTNSLGGIAGISDGSTAAIRRCIFKGTVEHEVANSTNIGGIVGEIRYSTISNCLADGADVRGYTFSAAIVGYRYKTSSGTVTGTLTANYYHDCHVTNSTHISSATVNVGVGAGDEGNDSEDQEGARSVHALTLSDGVTATGESVNINNVTHYASNTTVTLGYNNLPVGYQVTYSLNGTALSGNTFTMPASDSNTVSATITPITYNITYDLDGGSVATANPTSYNVTTNTFTLTNPTRTGYTFAGWTGTDLTQNTQTVTIAQGSIGNRSYTANWTPITYNITYDLDGGSVATANPTSYNVTTNTFTLNNPTKTGYTFDGWTGTDLTQPTQTVTITQGSIGDRSYIANWTPITYNITYNLNGGSVTPANPTSYNVTTNTFTLNNPTKTGYTFDGWTGTDLTQPTQTVTITQGSIGDRSYIANWTPITYIITYNLNGGSVTPANPTTYNIETPTFTLINPTKVACNFGGWTGSNGQTPETTVTITQGSIGDLSYTAHWTPFAYALTLGEGITATGIVAVTDNGINYYAPGTEITLAYTGTPPEGYRFAYYTVNNEPVEGNTFEMPAADAVVEAVLLERYYTYNSTTGELALLWGAFNKDNKWGSDVPIANVTSVTATNEVSFTGSCFELFRGFRNCTSMDLTDVNTANVTDMGSMFLKCSSIQSLNLSGWNTANVTNMASMFGECPSLQSLNLSGWNTANVTNMYSMFDSCRNLQSLDISGWNTTKVTNMSFMFQNCSSLQSLDLTGWNTANVTKMQYMFDHCSGLATIYVSTAWSTESVTSSGTGNMFSGCTNLVGGMNTAYDASHTNAEYARIDMGPNSDQPGYLTGVFALTLANDITASPEATLTHGNLNLYASGTTITLTYSGEVPEGTRFEYFTLNGEPIEGNTFTMPFGNTEVGVVFLAPYSFIDGVLSLNYGEFNKDNKWGSDVNVSAVTSVTATDQVSFTGDCFNLFSGFSNCTSMDLNNVNTEGVTNMAYMFSSCSNLNTLDLSGWNIANVTILNGMFNHCTNLKTLNLTGWDVSHVTDMPVMFMDCHRLTTIEGIKQWNTSNVTSMNSMFRYCKSFKSLDLLGWNTESLTDMGAMFQECDSIQTLNLSGWDVSHITNLNGLFYGCKSLETLDVSGWDVRNVTNMGSMFYNCLSLTTIHRSEWNTEKVTDMPAMFYRCSSLETLDLSDWNTENVTNINSMFTYCSNLTTIYVGEGWSTENVTESGGMFFDCTSLVGGMGTTYDPQHTDVEYAHIDGGPDNPGYLSRVRYTFNPETGELVLRFGEFNKDNKWGSDVTPSAVKSVTATNQVSFTDNCSSLFADFSNCTSMDLNNVNTERVTNMANIFGSCTNLKTLNLTGWDVSLVTNMTSMFISCHSLTTIEGIKQWNPSNVTNMAAMFEHCKSLKSLDLSGWNTASLTDMNTMFLECDSIQTLNLSGWDVSKITTMEALFHNCTSLETLDVSGWDVSNVTNMGVMFYGCSSLTTLNRSEWNTRNVTNMQAMFYGCSSLETLDISDWNTENVTNMISMFIYCSNLTTIYVGEGWSAENAASVGNGMFYDCTSLVGGMGTTYNIQHTNGDYAHIDYGTANPGYFTARLDPVEYIDADGNTQICTDYIVLEGSDDFISYGHDNVEAWYVVNHDVTYNASVIFRGGVNLILMDGATLNFVNESEEYKTVNFYENLTVYVQSEGTGAIVGNNVVLYSPEAIIHGGHFTLSNNYGNYALQMGDLTINGGIISAETNEEAIIVDLLTINGGTVTAIVTEDGNAIYAYDAVVINGGVVTTTNQQDGVGIYGYNYVTINGGIVTVSTTNDFVGIQAGYNDPITLGWTNEGDRITVSSYDGEVTIASGQAFSDEAGHCYMNTLTDEQIEAIAGQTLSPFNDFGATFSITYVTNGGTLPEGYPATYTFAETVTLPIPTKEDNTFAGWYDNATFEGDPITEIEAGTTLGNKTFYARWQPEYIDVTYLDADGQTQTIHAKVLYGKETGEYEYEGGVYTVLEGNFSVYDLLHFTGDATLILPDEGVLFAVLMGKESADVEAGLYVDGNLTIFGQEKGTGVLYAGLIHAGGNVNIYGGVIYTMSDLTSNDGNGTITLSWTALANTLAIYEYNGTVVLSKAFRAYNDEETIIIPAGQVSDNNTINAKYLTPYAETMDVSYIDEYGATHTVNAHVLYGGETILDGGYYTVIGGVYFNHTLSFEGNTTLIIPDDSNLYFEISSDDKGGIYPVEGNGITVNGNLAIYGQAGRQGYIEINATDAAVYATGDVTVSNLRFDYDPYSTYCILSGGDILIAGYYFKSWSNLRANAGNGTITLGYLTEYDYIECSGYEGTVVVREGQSFYYYDDAYEPVIISGTLTAEEVAAIAGEGLYPYIEPTITQTIALAEGWNWVSINIVIEDATAAVAMLDQLKEQLGENAEQIQSFNYTTEYQGDLEWFGDLDEIGVYNEQTYMIQAVAACEVVLTGAAKAEVEDYTIEINPGWNWIGFPNGEAVSVEDAMADFEAEEEDQIQSKYYVTEYTGDEWFGDLETFVPGQGYMYLSKSNVVKTLTFRIGLKKVR